jgi:cytochrome c oxidase subunit 2
MRIRVIAESQADFDRWILSQQKVPEIADDSIAQEGAMMFVRKTCLGCHSIMANSNEVHIGPDLSHFGSRQTILSGMMPNTNENLTRWLQNPQKVKEGALMPDFMLSKDEVKALATYLEGLK